MSLKEKILQFKIKNPNSGWRAIAKVLKCDHNTVKYHLDEKTRLKFAARRRINRRKNKTKLKLIFGGKCTRCGYDNCLDALHFHHKNNKVKVNTVSQLGMRVSLKEVYEEASKCELICANCHAEEHFKNRQEKICTFKDNNF